MVEAIVVVVFAVLNVFGIFAAIKIFQAFFGSQAINPGDIEAQAFNDYAERYSELD